MRTKKALKMWLSAIVLMLLTSTIGTAQYNKGDSGQYQILSARYGTERHNVDVTSRLKELARRDRTFRMDNSTFGVDPDYGAVKVLRIYAQDRNGRERMFEYTEGSTVDGAMFTAWSSGNWGRSGYNSGWAAGNGAAAISGQYEILQARYGTDRHNVDVTSRLIEMARRNRTFRMDNATFGVDPDRGVAKVLRIYTRDRQGRDRMFEYAEGSTVDGSVFTGWNSGNWGREGYNAHWDDRNIGTNTSLNIIGASYGAGRQRRDVTDRVRSMIHNGRLNIDVNNNTMGGDPAPNVAKELHITYATGSGRQQEVSAGEGQKLSVP